MKSKISNSNYSRLFMKHRIKLFSYLGFSSDFFRFKKVMFRHIIFQKVIFFSQVRNRCLISAKGKSVFSTQRISIHAIRIFSREGRFSSVVKYLYYFICSCCGMVNTVISKFILKIVGSNPT